MNDIEKSILIERIKSLCKLRGITPTTAYKESHVGKNFTSNLKNSNPSEGKLTMLAGYFGVSIDYLLGKTDDMQIDKGLLSEDEKLIINKYRFTTAEGKRRITQFVLDICNEIEKTCNNH